MGTESPAEPPVTDIIATTVKSITDLISTISPKTSTDSIPTEASTTLDSDITTVQTIMPSTTQQPINVTTVKKIESTDEVTFITTIKPDSDTTTAPTTPPSVETTETEKDTTESPTESTVEDNITTTIKSITDFITTLSSVTTSSPTTITDEDISDNEIIPDEEEDTSHTLECTPSTSMGPTPDGMPFDCKDQEAKEETTPFIVIIRLSSEDLLSVLTKRVKVVVKDFMLMDMPAAAQQPLIDENLSPK